MKNINNNLCVRLFAFLCLSLIWTFLHAQNNEDNEISINVSGIDSGYCVLSDTIQVSLSSLMESGDKKEVYVDLITPFEEVAVLRKAVLHKGKALVRIPILPLWETGFYQMRIYEQGSSKILSTRTIPVLAKTGSKDIPVWYHEKNVSDFNDSWCNESNENSSFVRGVLLTNKLKPLHKAGVKITAKECGQGETHCREWNSESGKNGEFVIEIPKSVRRERLVYTFTFKGRQKKCQILLFPNGLSPFLSKEYESDIKSLYQKLGLSLVKMNEEQRSYYIYDMQREAFVYYFQGKKIPVLGDWFVSKKRFALAMKNEHRAVGWNARRFSMWPSKMFRIGEHRYRRHTLNAGGTSYAMHTPYATHTVNGGAGADFSSGTVGEEGAPRIGINNLSSVIVLSGHGLETLISPNMYRDYIKPYDPIMVYFE